MVHGVKWQVVRLLVLALSNTLSHSLNPRLRYAWRNLDLQGAYPLSFPPPTLSVSQCTKSRRHSLTHLKISHPIMYLVKATRFNHGLGAGENDEKLVLTCISPLTGPSQIYFSLKKTKISPSARLNSSSELRNLTPSPHRSWMEYGLLCFTLFGL